MAIPNTAKENTGGLRFDVLIKYVIWISTDALNNSNPYNRNKVLSVCKKKRPSDNSARVQIFGLGANLILIWIFQDDLLFKILLVAVFYTQTSYGTEKTSQHFLMNSSFTPQRKKLLWT